MGKRAFISLLVFYFMATLFLIFMSVKVARAENQIIAKAGYDVWINSGHTFARSDVKDKEFNRFCFEVEYNHYDDIFGMYAYIGADEKVREQIYQDYFFEMNQTYAGIGFKARKRFDDLTLYGGYGFNVIHMDITTTPKGDESYTNPGFDILTGIATNGNPFFVLDVRYSYNRIMSDKFHLTTWNPGGLRTWVGVGLRF